MNKKGFTLIELLAVIIILGILMIIAIPSVTKYISDSRKSAYVDTAKEIIAGTRNIVNDGKLEMFSTDTTYYISSGYVKTENASKSPYGDFVHAYVGVTYDGKGYKYYWISVDETGQGVKDIIAYDKLDTDNIVSDINKDDISDTIRTTGIGDRHYIKILKDDGTWESDIYLGDISGNVSEEGGETSESGSGGANVPVGAVYPSGKDKTSVDIGDIVTIGTEEFYVIKTAASLEDDLVLLAHYNLKVGNIYRYNENHATWMRDDLYTKLGEYSNTDSGYGKQSSEAKGYVSDSPISHGTVVFSYRRYWIGKIGSQYSGVYCYDSDTSASGKTCAYVYDSNSTLKTYIDAYKLYLEGQGLTIKDARLLKIEEAFALGCTNGSAKCHNAPSWVHETTFWLGTVEDTDLIYSIYSDGRFQGQYIWIDNDSDPEDTTLGIRPVIVI